MQAVRKSVGCILRCSAGRPLLPLAPQQVPGLRHYSYMLDSGIIVPSSYRPAGEPVLPASTLMSFGGPSHYEEDDVEDFCSHAKQFPLLDQVPKHRLIIPDPLRPYLFSEIGKSLFRQGLIITDVSYNKGVRTSGVFQRDNVIVFKKLRALGLRGVNPSESEVLDETAKRSGFVEWKDFFLDVLVEIYGADVLQKLPPECVELFSLFSQSPLDDELIINNAALLPRISRAILIMRIYTFLIKEVPLRLKDNITLPIFSTFTPKEISEAITAILESMPYSVETSDPDLWTDILLKQTFLNAFIPKIGKNAVRLATGEGLLVMHRHGVVHPIDKAILDLIIGLDADHKASLTALPHTFEEVLDLYQYAFPLFLSSLLKSFKQENVYEVLKVLDLFHVPSSYA